MYVKRGWRVAWVLVDGGGARGVQSFRRSKLVRQPGGMPYATVLLWSTLFLWNFLSVGLGLQYRLMTC